jgi:hypothetical protein
MKNYHFLTLGLFLFFSCCEKKSETENSSAPSYNYLSASGASASASNTDVTYTLFSTGNQREVTSYAANDQSSRLVQNTNPTKALSPTATKKIIKNASIRFQVEDFKQSRTRINKAIKDSGGYISISSEDGLSSATTIRVSSPQLEALINEILKEVKFLNHNNIRSNDVTAQYIDTETRLKTKKEVEKRYLDILKQAKTIEDILRVEGQLAAIREEIEAKEGQLKQINDEVNYSTIHLEYYETTETSLLPEDGFPARIKKGIKTGWDILVSFVVGIFYIWPFLILAGFVLFLFRRWKGGK